MFFKIGFDGGYGNTVLATSRNDILEIPSVVGGGFKKNFSDIFGYSKQCSANNLHVQLDGQDYFIGNLALKESKTPSSAFSTNKISHPNNRIILAAATALLMRQEQENMILVGSLPFVEFVSQKQEYQEYLKTFEADITLIGGSREVRRNIKFCHTAVFPQAVAAVYYIVSHYPSYAQTSTFAIVDIGMKTMDVVVIEIENEIEIIESMSFGAHAGVSIIHDYLSRAVTEKTGLTLAYPVLDTIIRNNGKWHRHNFYEAIRAAKKELMRIVVDKISEKWTDQQKQSVSTMFLIGGGGQYLHDEFAHNNILAHADIILPPTPRIANAKGCLEIAKGLEQRIASGL